MNTPTKIMGLGAACVACCALPSFGVMLAGTAFISIVSAYAGWIAVVGGLAVTCFLLLRPRYAVASNIPCGCASGSRENSLGEAEARPIACTLEPGAYSERVAWITELAKNSLISSHREDLSLHLIYAPEAALHVRAMVEKEKACCAFLTFELSENPSDVRLKITAPEEAREAADLLFAHFAPAS